MRKSFWKGLRLADLIVIFFVVVLFIGIIYYKYDTFACTSMQSEAKFSLQQIAAAQMLYFNEFGSFATINKLESEKRIDLAKLYYNFVDGPTKPGFGFSAKAVGKAKTLVDGEIWEIDEKKSLTNVVNKCQK